MSSQPLNWIGEEWAVNFRAAFKETCFALNPIVVPEAINCLWYPLGSVWGWKPIEIQTQRWFNGVK